jgi:two-component system NarL family sensor kinase
MINPEQIQWAIFLAMLAMLMMAVFVIAFVIYYQKKQLEQEKKMHQIEKENQQMLLETALNSEESERRRIAQDLHDDIGTMLSLTKLSLNQLSKSIRKDEILPADSPLSRSQTLVEETILHVRRITRDLVPTTLEHFGLAAAIEEFIHRLQAGSSLSVNFQCDTESLPRQSQKIELTLFRIAQELVNNAIKHSGCNEINVDLLINKEHLELLVTDNGKGFDAAAIRSSRSGGLGLRNIESRLSIVKGKVQYKKPPLAGSCAHIQVPLETHSIPKPEPLHPFRPQRVN